MRTPLVIGISIVALVVAVIAVFVIGDEKEQAAVAPAAAIPTQQAEEPAPVVDTKAPSFDVVRISLEGTGVIAGRASPEAFVEVLVDGELLGRVRTNSDGEWVLIFDTPLKVGSQELSLRAEVAEGAPLESANVVVVSVPERQMASFEERPAYGVVAVLTPRNGKGISRVLQRPGVFRTAVELGVDTLDFDEERMAAFAGFAPANTEIRLYIDNAYMTAVSADATGRWSFRPSEAISSGEHILRLDQIFEGDDVEMRVEQPFDPSLALDISLAETSVMVQSGNNLWNIARRIYGHGLLYTQIFQANETQIRDPDKIYPGQKFVLPRDEAQREEDDAPGT
ncbi:MAG: LysM peptidoglycan-binding domain-containing protein [Proteobacteria bacterium]|nr:LysM peptidoglycan-binding domain-containing protein [Pseudomonadota bacterium]